MNQLRSYNLLMRKGQQIKNKKLSTRDILRFPAKNEKNGEKYTYEAPSSNYLITIKAEKAPKGSEPPNFQTDNLQKPRKLKYITEGIEKSTQDLLSIRSQSNQRQRSIKQSTQNIEDEFAYQICRSSKKSRRKGEKSGRKSEEKNSQKDNANTGNIKARKQKSQSKQHLQLNFKSPTHKNTNKSNKKLKPAPKTSRKSQINPHSRRFLSPELVKLQNSYYFSNADESQGIPRQSALPLPKKESKYIFESNHSVWHELPQKKLMNSVLNPLADY